jgi:hypothetical protein
MYAGPVTARRMRSPLEGELVPSGCPALLFRPSDEQLHERLVRMLSRERDCLPRPDLIEAVQRDGMRPVWRSKVASWLLEFEEEFDITQDTIAAAVNYMDRYLSQVSTKRSLLQLLAISAILVASKLHEAFPLRVSELRELADGTYQESDIKLMELELLRVIQWQLHPVTPQAVMSHLVLFVEDAATCCSVFEDAVTFLDVALPEYEFLTFHPSAQAAASILCAFETSGLAGAQEWRLRVRQYGVLDGLAVELCKQRMLAVFNSFCPQQPPLARADHDTARVSYRDTTPSPTGVDELMRYDQDEPMPDARAAAYRVLDRGSEGGAGHDHSRSTFPPVQVLSQQEQQGRRWQQQQQQQQEEMPPGLSRETEPGISKPLPGYSTSRAPMQWGL